MNWLRNIKMRSKLFFALGLLVVIMALLNMFTLSQFVDISSQYSILINTTMQRYIRASEALQILLQIRFHNIVKMYAAQGGIYENLLSQAYGDLDPLIDDFHIAMTGYRENLLSNNFLSAADKEDRMKRYQKIIDIFDNDFAILSAQIVEAVANNNAAEMNRLIPIAAGSAIILHNELLTLCNIAGNTVQEKTTIVEQHYINALEVIIFVAIAAIVLATILSLMIASTIQTPVQHMQKAMYEISKGNFSYSIRSTAKDELGILANSIANMIDTIVEMNKTATIMNYTESMITITDRDFNIVYLNKQAINAHGLGDSEYLNKKCYKALKRQDGPCLYCPYPKEWPNKEDAELRDIDYVWDDTLKLWLSGKFAVIRWVDGNLVMFHSFSDATLKKNYEETLKSEKQAAELESTFKTNFLSNMSHDIRTPMNAIIGMTDLLAHETLSQRQENYVKDISLSARSLLSLINDILDLSKIESGKLALILVDYDFRAFMDNIISMFTFVAQKKELEFIFEPDEELPEYLYGDDVRLRQVLTNLCDNAIKYTEKGHVKLKLTVAENELVFEISDTGMGIKKEELPKLFDAFERANAEKTRTITGTGLGLSICKSFVEMMDGKILVDSEYEKGSTFTVIIPKVLGKKSGVKFKKSLAEELTLHTVDTKILVVDDNEFNLKVANGLLNLFDIDVRTADSGKKAIAMAQQEDFDIIFMDHMMPDMDGLETTAHIRKLGGKFEKIPIIALTANAIHGAKETFLANGLNDFIAKPIDMSELQAMLIQWLPQEKMRTNAVEKYEKQNIETHDDFIAALSKISDVDTDIGLSHVSGIISMYKKTFEFFFAKLVTECDGMSDKLAAEDLKGFMISVHAMKSSLATLGIRRLSEEAAKLEVWARENDLTYCKERYPELREKLLAFYKKLIPIFTAGSAPAAKKKEGDMQLLQSAARQALDAAHNFDQAKGARILTDLLAYDFGETNNKLLEKAAAAFNDFEYDDVKEILDKLNVTSA